MTELPISGSGSGEEPGCGKGVPADSPRRAPGLPGNESGSVPDGPRVPGVPGVPDPVSGLPGPAPAIPGPPAVSGAQDSGGGGRAAGRDPRLAAFAQHEPGDSAPPSAALGVILDELSGPERRCAGATDNELLGLMNRWAAMESWAAAGKLGVVRELVRRRPAPGSEAREPGGPPLSWARDTEYEISPALGISLRAADKLLGFACVLETRLPGVGRALAEGRLDYGKALLIVEGTAVLDDARAAVAEEIILAGMAGKTWYQLQQLVGRVVATVDPDGTRKRREEAQREEARVRLWREHSGACAMAAFGLPPDEALAANANIEARAQEYRAAGLKAGIDLLRVMAFADIINNVPAAARIARARDPGLDQPSDGSGGSGGSGDGQTGDTGHVGSTGERRRGEPVGDDDASGSDGAHGEGSPAGLGPGDEDPAGEPASGSPAGDSPADQDSPDGGSGVEGARDQGRPGQSGAGIRPDPANPELPSRANPGLAARVNLTIPLATFLGLAKWPGSAHGLGALDPALARDLAAAAARSTASEWCVTITSPEGYAIGHGCARPSRPSGPPRPPRPPGLSGSSHPPRASRGPDGEMGPGESREPCGGPGAGRGREPDSSGRQGPVGQDPDTGKSPGSRPGTGRRRGADADASGPGGRDGPPSAPFRAGFTWQQPPGTGTEFGTWALTLPGTGQPLMVRLGPVPVTECDHRHQSRGYQPSDKLRHLIQVRDGECTFPTCTRHARETDFEHAVPYDQGGRTCACNAGARSRTCHQVKQSPGWTVTQPRPGWHEWTAPSGRVYIQEPMRYPGVPL